MNILSDTIYKLPVLPLRGLVVFPKTLLNFDVARKKSIAAIKSAMNENQMIFLVAQRDISVTEPDDTDLYKMGVVAKIVQVLKQPDDTTRVVVEGITRAEILNFEAGKNVLCAEVQTSPKENMPDNTQELALLRSVKGVFEQYIHLVPKMPSDVIYKVAVCKKGGELADYITNNIVLDYQIKQIILDCSDPAQRLQKLLEILSEEMSILKIQNEICDRAKSNIDDAQRKYFLREQLNVIEEELGEEESPVDEAEEYAEQIEALEMEDSSKEILLKECKKLAKMPFGAQEATVVRTYLDTVLELPWNTKTKDVLNLSKIRKTLDKNHYGLKKVKERIVEQLAVKQLNPDAKGQILCLAGPPGVGKTSIAQSIAEAMNRKSARIALGGVKDEAEIRGHRKTYIGSMPGRIMNGLKLAGSSNPVLILDEIDKLSNDYKGDPTSALLEVLDAEQNHSFCDHYIDVPFDLSNVFFITTANDLSAVPDPLRDRMEVIELDSYTREEKFAIAKKHLIPKQYKACGLDSKAVRFTKTGIYALIDFYTSEAGVRTLERIIASVLRKCAVQYLDGVFESISITDKNIESLLGPKKYLQETLPVKDEIGVVNGLAWTSVGGTLLPIEAVMMPGTGKIELTGSLGDIMQESAKAAISCIRSKADFLRVDPDFYKSFDIHIHAPEGAVPKDGPSAGITMATAIYSALSSRPVKRNVAMTGEITLRGKVLPIGGLKEKSMAAYKSGVKTIIIPKENYRDLSEFDEVLVENLEFVPVETIEQVLDIALIPVKKAKDESFENLILAEETKVSSHTVRQ